MAFLNGFGERVSKAAQAAAKKSNELVETTKINMNISSEEEKIQKLYKQIGQIVFENFRNNLHVDENMLALCEQIGLHEKTILELKDKLMVIKNIKLCPSCGTEVQASVSFCSKCGAKQEIPEVYYEEEPAKLVCPSCNVFYEEGTVFCSNCGHKVVE